MSKKKSKMPKLARKKLVHLKAKKKFKKQRCAFVSSEGVQCAKSAKGKSTLCRKHAGKAPALSVALQCTLSAAMQYDDTYHPMQFITLAAQGLTPVEIAADFRVSASTIRNWTEKYKSFELAVQIGADLTEAFYTAEARKNLTNPRYNTSLFKYLTGNTIGWAEKTEAKNLNMNLHGVLAVPATPGSNDEWEEQYAVSDKDDKVIDV